MHYWLLKTEPEEFSIDDLKKRVTPWTGVRNFVARNHMIAMKENDLVFIYHTGKEKAIVGIGKVANEAHPDELQFDPKSDYFDETSTKDKPKWKCVDVAFVEKLRRSVTLAEVKADPKLGQMVLAHAPRLSVQPVSKEQFDYIIDELQR